MSKISQKGWKPLFTEYSASTTSQPFHINAGEVAIIQAYGFTEFTVDKPEGAPKTTQKACIDKLLWESGPLPSYVECGEPLLSGRSGGSEIVGEEQVYTERCAWTMDACHNIGILNIPGSYRMELNDTGALGIVRIYYMIVSVGAFPWNSKLFFGE